MAMTWIMKSPDRSSCVMGDGSACKRRGFAARSTLRD
jgi:hypothetical protein